MKKIKLSLIYKIQRATMRIFEEEDNEPEYVDYRVVRANERAIQHYLDLITSDTKEQNIILEFIRIHNFNTNDLTYKPICDDLRKLGYEIIKE